MQQLYPEIEVDYTLHETLGTGGFATVKAATHKLTGEKVAIKIMDKEELGRDVIRVYREIETLKRLHHQHICQMYQVIETESMIHLVLEFCPGGELFDYIVANERLSEREARSFFRQIVSALCYCHTSGIVHRDLKPENLLLDEDSNIKLIDFGLVANPNSSKDLLETCCGSPAYAAPELLIGGPYIGTKVDVWSLGVLLYALLNGFLPFDDDNTAKLYSIIQKGEYDTPDWLSQRSIAMLAELLKVNPHDRATVNSLLCHPWVVSGYNNPVDWKSRLDMERLDTECVSVLADYQQKSFDMMSSEILEWSYDNTTATYFLLFQQKLNGRKPKLVVRRNLITASRSLCPFPNNSLDIDERTSPEEPEDISHEQYFSPQGYPVKLNNGSSPRPKPKTRKISLGIQIHPPSGELVTVQKSNKSAAISIVVDESINDYASPTTHSLTAYVLSPTVTRKNYLDFPPQATIPQSRTMDNFQKNHEPQFRLVSKTFSYESNLQHAVDVDLRLEKSKTIPAQPITPRTRRRLKNLEDIFIKAKKALSLSKPSSSNGPRKLKGIYNLDTTSRKSPEEVMFEIENVLRELGLKYDKDNYLFHCSVNSYKESSSYKRDKAKTILFDLEVCYLPRLEMLGVRRKRIKGDTWEYKHICGQIFSITRL